jgi:hypothetical protein
MVPLPSDIWNALIELRAAQIYKEKKLPIPIVTKPKAISLVVVCAIRRSLLKNCFVMILSHGIRQDPGYKSKIG